MDPERYARHQGLFERCMELEGEAQQREFLARECGADSELAREVQELLGFAHEPAGAFSEDGLDGAREQMEQLVDSAFAPEVSEHESHVEDWCPERIGPYQVLRVLGRGGMGVVYEALQSTPRRKVAVKLVHPAFATRTVKARFRQEVEVLGRLHHPGIAQVFEGDTFDSGQGVQPYLAMELVEGQTLMDYVHGAGLDLRERVALLSEICDAVAHAHERGIVHRDIKPANVMVTEDGRTKLLDFGIARVIDGDLVSETIMTSEGQLMGTVSYMSPEQVSGDLSDVGPASDVYSLGALGLELLSGRLPHDTVGMTITAAIRTVSHEPARKLRSLLPGAPRDMEVVLGKALEHRLVDRYPSARALGADLRRFLETKPIQARAPGLLDRSSKFVRRNPLLVGAAAAVTAALLIGIVSTGREADRAQRNLYPARTLLGTQAALEAGGAARALEWADLSSPDELGLDLRGWEWYFLNSFRGRAQVMELAGNYVAAPNWHPREAHIATADAEGLVVLDAQSGAELSRCRFGQDQEYPPLVLSVAFDPSGTRLAFCGYMTVGVWVVGEEQPLWVEWGVVNEGIVWANDGESCVFAGHRVMRRDADTGSVLASTPEDDPHYELLKGVGKSPDGTQFLVGRLRPNALLALDLESLSVVQTLDGHDTSISSTAWSPDGKRGITTAFDGTVRVWDLEVGGPSRLLTQQKSAVTCAAWHPSGDRIATSSYDSAVRVFEAEYGAEINRLEGHVNQSLSLAWQPDGTHLASASKDGTLRVWDAESVTPYLRLPIPETTFPEAYEEYLSWSPDGSLIHASRTEDQRGWNRKTNQWSYQTNLPGSQSLDPSARHVARREELPRGEDGSPRAEVLLGEWAGEKEQLKQLGADELLPEGEVYSRFRFDWHPSAPRLLVTCDHANWLCELGQGWAPTRFPFPKRPSSVAWHPGLDWLGLTLHDNNTLVVNFSGVSLASMGDLPPGTALNWSPEGERLALATDERQIVLRGFPGGESLGELRGHTQRIEDVVWHPGGDRLATGSRDSTVAIWSPDSLQQVGMLRCDGPVLRIAWSPDGMALAALTQTSLYLFDATQGYR